STLALLFSALLSPIDNIRASAESLFEESDLSHFKENIPLGKKGWFTIRLVGSKTDPIKALTEATYKAAKDYWPKLPSNISKALNDINSPRKLIESLLLIAETLEDVDGGVLVVIDEMGKLLE